MRKAIKQLRRLKLYKTNRDIFNAAAKGTLTTRSMLKIEYGAFPMKGMHEAIIDDRPISIKSFFEDKEYKPLVRVAMSAVAAGAVRTRTPHENDNTLYFSTLIPPLFNAIVGLHLFSIYNLLSSSIPLAVTIPISLALTALMSRMAPLSPLSDTIGHEHTHLMQRYDRMGLHDKDRNIRWTGFNCFSNIWGEQNQRAAKDAGITLSNNKKYLSSDCEIQARLHTLITKGYRKRWHKLPATKEELWAALIDAGLKAPEGVHEHLEKTTNKATESFLKPGLTATFNRHARHTIIKTSETHELNAAREIYKESGSKEKLWEETLPYLYGHLLELYGDRTGRLKMGYTGEILIGLYNKLPVPLASQEREATFNEFLKSNTEGDIPLPAELFYKEIARVKTAENHRLGLDFADSFLSDKILDIYQKSKCRPISYPHNMYSSGTERAAASSPFIPGLI